MFEDFVEEVPLVDHHVHAAFRDDGGEARFANALNEAGTTNPAAIAVAYDSQVGFAVRRWCPSLLDLPVHVPPAQYWRRRTELGEAEVTRRFTRAAGVSDWLVDTGFAAGDLLGTEELAAASGGATHEILRLETLAESLIGSLADPGDFADAFRTAVACRAPNVLGAKSILAYRTGFDQDLRRPGATAVARAARRWSERVAHTAVTRLDDPTLIAYGIHTAVDAGMPLQLHTGYGDRDLDLRRTNPLLLLDFFRAHEATGVPVLLLHCYPFEREAGYLAQAFDTVHLDVGLATNFLGARSRELVARSLELAPFSKVLYSSDACGPAELHYLGARLWREAISAVVGEWVAGGDWSRADARRVVTLLARDNARRVYGLP